MELEAVEDVNCLEGAEDCNCYFCSLFGLLGRKWTMHLVGVLTVEGTVRFNELKRRLDGISPRMLSNRLEELEDAGLVERIDHGTIPPKVEYALTDQGEGLDEVYGALLSWADEWDVDLVRSRD